MKRLLICMMLIFSSCATVGSKITKDGSTVEVFENGATTSISYKSYQALYEELEEKKIVQLGNLSFNGLP